MPEDDVLGTARRPAAVVAVIVVAVVALVGAALAFLLVPRTVEAAESGTDAWRLQVVPGITGSTIELAVRGNAQADDDRVRHDVGTAGLSATTVWHVGADDSAETRVIGPIPTGAASIRLTSVEHGVGEARLQRVGWRSFHVARLPGHVEVTQLVAVAPDGGIVQTEDRVGSR